MKFVQIADSHLDDFYKEGSFADCGSNICCRDSTGKSHGSINAGKFGSLDGPCDTPEITYRKALEFIRDELKPDAIFWTGDNSAHSDENVNEEYII